MLSRAVRVALNLAKGWLGEAEVATNHNYGVPPSSYEDSNLFFKTLVSQNTLKRPHFLWGALQGVNLAKALGIGRVSFLEFGVAGGNGLVALEGIAQRLEAVFNIQIDV